MKESARYILQILVFLALILAVGTAGYLLIEDGIRTSDAFYMAVTAITPTQFDEVHKLSVAGRYFTVILVFCGFGAVVAFATQFARLIIQSELEGVGVITRKQMRRRISRMKSHYIVCGFGEIGGAICGELKDQQLPFVVIANDEESIAAIQREGYPLVRGNPTADVSLKEAEVERAIGVIAVLADDSDNLFISLAARELNPKIFIIARGEDASVEDRILRAGADIVVSPMKLGGQQIASLIRKQANIDTGSKTAVNSGEVLGVALHTYHHANSDSISIADLLKNQNAIGVAGIHRPGGKFESSPAATAVVQRDDTAVLIKHSNGNKHAFHKPPSGKTILIADDHRALRLLYARKLAWEGHDVIQAASGDEAIQKAFAQNPDLIVLDCDMPNRNGYDVATTLRESTTFAKTPIILYSGNQSSEFQDRGTLAGANVCLRKSSQSSELLEKIETLFHSRHAPTGRSVAANADQKTVGNGPSAIDLNQTPSAFDPSIALQNADGDAGLVAELIEALQEDTPRIMSRLQQAMDQHDMEGVRRETHMLKSSVAIVGAQSASEIAGQMELAAQQNDFDVLKQLHGSLEQQVAALLTQLERAERACQ